MLKLESIAAFSAVAEAGSITGAARRLSISKSVISERLSELERVVATTLMRRTTRNLTLTDDGKIFYERAKQILRDVENAASELTERRGAPWSTLLTAHHAIYAAVQISAMTMISGDDTVNTSCSNLARIGS